MARHFCRFETLENGKVSASAVVIQEEYHDKTINSASRYSQCCKLGGGAAHAHCESCSAFDAAVGYGSRSAECNGSGRASTDAKRSCGKSEYASTYQYDWPTDSHHHESGGRRNAKHATKPDRSGTSDIADA